MKQIIITEEEYTEITKKLDQLLSIIKGNHSESEQLMESDELLSFIKISSRTLQNYRDKGIIPFYQIGRKILYNKSEVVKALDRFKQSVNF